LATAIAKLEHPSARAAPGRPARAGAPAPALRFRVRPFASLTARILAVNVLALAILVAGLLYLDAFRRGLVEAKTESLFTQAEMIAGALGEGAARIEAEDRIELDLDAVTQLLPRLIAPTDARARLFDPSGALVADSERLAAAARGVGSRILPPPADDAWYATLWLRLQHGLATLSSPTADLPRYRERIGQTAADYGEVVDALVGERGYAHRIDDDGLLILTVAVPVQRFKQVVAALLLSATGVEIAASVREVQIAILRIFGASLVVTILLSLYLAGTIARPIRALAAAADRVRRGFGERVTIPDFSGRGDEIGTLSRSLGAMTRALYQRLDAIEAFAADVAHELRNPLTSVKSATETLARTADPERQRHLIALIQSDLKRLDRLISDISDASRLDAELTRAAFGPVDLGRIATVMAEIHAATAGPGAPTVTVVRAARSPLIVDGIEDRLGQVVRNLVGNAVSFSPPGGVITLAVAAAEDAVELAVEDQGPGIPDDRLERIFDRFYSARPSGEAFGQHSGLGLSISRQIVAAHGGVIRAENRRDAEGRIVGARFVVRLPTRRAGS